MIAVKRVRAKLWGMYRDGDTGTLLSNSLSAVLAVDDFTGPSSLQAGASKMEHVLVK